MSNHFIQPRRPVIRARATFRCILCQVRMGTIDLNDVETKWAPRRLGMPEPEPL